MNSPRFLLAAALLPALSSAVPTVIIFDDFTTAQFVGVGNGTANDTITLANGITRKLIVTGTRASQTSIDIAGDGTASFSSPSLSNSSYSIEYTKSSGTWSFLQPGNTLDSTALTLSLVFADLPSEFSWTAFDGTNTATWGQDYGATNTLVNYSSSLTNFAGGSPFNWASVQKLTLVVSGAQSNDAVFTTGFGFSYANAIPVPEPSTYGLVIGGLALAAVAIRRRRQAK